MDVTIKRWLHLQPGEYLVLECGEDIDTVFAAMSQQPDELNRVLEQVKHREHNVTIHSEEVVSALVNYVATRERNLGVKLAYRFTTTANIGIERPTLMPDGQAALHIWEQIQEGLVPSAEQLQKIREALTSYRIPSGVNPDAWTTFVQVVRIIDDCNLEKLIHGFELVTNSTSADSITREIQQTLLTSGYANSKEHANELYHRLFVHVIRLLTQKGEKGLTSDSLAQVLTQSTFSVEFQQHLQNVTQVLNSLTKRMDALEENMNQLGAFVRAGAGLPPDAALSYTEPLVLNVPPLVQNHSQRTQTIESLVTILQDDVWVAVTGGIGWGKTQLAALTAQIMDCKAWLRFRDMDAAGAVSYLYRALSQLANGCTFAEFQKLCDAACSQIGRGNLIVLDDLPQVEGGAVLEEHLLYLAQVCADHGVSLLSTSIHALPSHVHEVLGTRIICEMPVPPLTDVEAKEILLAFGGGEDVVTDHFASMVNAFANRHPVLVVAAAKYMHTHQWVVDVEAMGALLTSSYAQEAKTEAFRRLLNTVQDDDSREMLYRLSLCTSAFSLALIRTLATISPPIDHPRETIIPLDGLWIQCEDADSYRISPLVSRLGETELPEDRKQNCHKSIGEWVIAKRKLSPLDLMDALGHFQMAGDFNRAGYLFATALFDLNKQEQPVEDYGLLHIWWDMRLPDQMDLRLRITIRALQTAVGNRRGNDTSKILADLDALVDQAGVDEWFAVLTAIGLNLTLFTEEHVRRANKYMLKVIKTADINILPTQLQNALSKLPAAIETIIWLNVWNINSEEERDQWLDLIESLSPSQREVACSDKLMYEMSCMRVTSKIWLNEVNKPLEQRDWNEALQKLQAIADRGKRAQFELLWAWAVWSQIIIYGEYFNDIDLCISTGESAIQESSGDHHTLFVLYEGVGRQYFFAGKYELALEWLRRAVDSICDNSHLYAAEAMLRISQCVALINPNDLNEPVKYCKQAVEYLQSRAELNEEIARKSGHSGDDIGLSFGLVKALGEYGIAHWLSGEQIGAFAAFDSAAESLIQERHDDLWKELLVLLSHVSGYVSSIAVKGTPPSGTSDGDEYAEPRRGLFLGSNPKLVELYAPGKECLLSLQLAQFAEAISKDDKANHWASLALTQCKETKYEFALVFIVNILLPDYLTHSRYMESIELMLQGVEAGISFGQAEGLPEKNFPGPANTTAEIARLMENEFAVHWSAATILHLCNMALRDRRHAGEEANAAALACLAMAEHSTDSELWNQLSSFLQLAFADGTDARVMLQRSSDPSQSKVPALLLNLVVSILPGLQIEEYLAALLSSMEYLLHFYSENTTIYRSIVLLFIQEYWLLKVRDNRFMLRNPNEVEAALQRAIQGPLNIKVRAIFRAVIGGLNVRIGDKLSDWLYSD
ncbi:MAG: hypothetical protein ACYC7E_01885 [Armatimonadota bacterium]